jgi:hypothetical protein
MVVICFPVIVVVAHQAVVTLVGMPAIKPAGLVADSRSGGAGAVWLILD